VIGGEAKWSPAPMPAGDIDRLCLELAARPLPPDVAGHAAARRVLFVPSFDVPQPGRPGGHAYPVRHGVTLVAAAAVLAALR